MKTDYSVRFVAAAAVAVAACVPSLAAAQNCKEPVTTMEMKQCASRDLNREDARLNKSYRDLLAKLEPARREKLREVQRVWLTFRDLNCEFQSAEYEGGTIYTLVQMGCVIEMTKQRNKDLKAMLEDSDR